MLKNPARRSPTFFAIANVCPSIMSFLPGALGAICPNTSGRKNTCRPRPVPRKQRRSHGVARSAAALPGFNSFSTLRGRSYSFARRVFASTQSKLY